MKKENKLRGKVTRVRSCGLLFACTWGKAWEGLCSTLLMQKSNSMVGSQEFSFALIPPLRRQAGRQFILKAGKHPSSIGHESWTFIFLSSPHLVHRCWTSNANKKIWWIIRGPMLLCVTVRTTPSIPFFSGLHSFREHPSTSLYPRLLSNTSDLWSMKGGL